MTETSYPPRHVAIIMDGNGRWAKKRGLPRLAGHNAGGDNIRPVVKSFADSGVKYLTLYMFSTENWNRPRIEVTGLLSLLARKIDRETRAFHQENIRLVHLGRLDRLSQILRKKVQAAVDLTKDNSGLTLCLAFDYGGRDEIVQAAKCVASAGIPCDNIDESVLGRYLYLPDIPDPDLVIRTGGESRLSNFLLWQAAYSELYFTPVLWPDFGRTDIDEALSEYERRQRRFGRL
ncbi:MAG: di-trans,poly-cis-decaprenylcistransferase [Chloroflexi bacterium RBG_13_51_36]|nr:MAG: di-trans,poly-cis-decaprenylcistransferase [Chloroflexi bacterium RBG_13_51_36]